MKKFLLAFALLASTLLHAQNTKIERPAFTLEYPASWTVDTEDPDYDPDGLFALDADDNTTVMFVLMDGEIDPKSILEEQVKSLKASVISKPDSMSSFTRWGAYTGQGREMCGKIQGQYPTTIRMFAFQHRGRTILVVAQCLNADRQRHKAGFDLVERSFRFK